MVNYGECRSVGLRWLDISLFSCRLDHGTTSKKPTVGHGKPDTGHCSLKQLMAPGRSRGKTN
jgi:hypothetical protein